MGKLIKDNGRFYLFNDDGTYTEVSDDLSKSINEDIKKRLDLELRLAKYNAEFDSQVQSRLATTISQLSTAHKHIKNLTTLGNEILELWSRGENLHGTILKLRNELELVLRWIEDTKNK